MTRTDIMRALRAEIEAAEKNLNSLRTAYEALASMTKPAALTVQSPVPTSKLPDLLDEVLSDGESRTIDDIYDILRDRGHAWQKGSIATALSRGASKNKFKRVGPGTYRAAVGQAEQPRATTPSSTTSLVTSRAPQSVGEVASGDDDDINPSAGPSDDDIPF